MTGFGWGLVPRFDPPPHGRRPVQRGPRHWAIFFGALREGFGALAHDGYWLEEGSGYALGYAYEVALVGEDFDEGCLRELG